MAIDPKHRCQSNKPRAVSILLEGAYFGATAGVREAVLASLQANISAGIRVDELQVQLAGLIYGPNEQEDETYAHLLTDATMTFAKHPSPEAYMRLFHPTLSVEGLKFRRDFRENSLLSGELNESAHQAGLPAPKRSHTGSTVVAETTVEIDADLFHSAGVKDEEQVEQLADVTRGAPKHKRRKTALSKDSAEKVDAALLLGVASGNKPSKTSALTKQRKKKADKKGQSSEVKTGEKIGPGFSALPMLDDKVLPEILSIREAKKALHLNYLCAQKQLDIMICNARRDELRNYTKVDAYTERCLRDQQVQTDMWNSLDLDLEPDDPDDRGMSVEDLKVKIRCIYKKDC